VDQTTVWPGDRQYARPVTTVERTPDLLTPRLCLHPLTVEESRRIVDETPNAQDRWADGFPREDDRDGVRGFLHLASSGIDPAPFGTYRVDLDSVAVGTIGFFGPPDDDGQVMLGYGLVPAARGHGYATEAVGRLVELCRSHQGVRAMFADTDTDNLASQRVLTKNGFEFVREADALRYYRLDVSTPSSLAR
jgi:RimJ/RimL family protein N-acetyltransferase